VSPISKFMTKIPLLLFSVFAVAMSAANEPPRPELLQVKSVYLLPMHFGFDQYLANEISRMGIVRVVIDPAQADAVLTDRLGDALEQKLDEIMPRPAPAGAKTAESTATKPAAEGSGESAKSATEPASETKPASTSTDRKKSSRNSPLDIFNAADPNAAHPATTFSSGRGNVFLIDRGTRSVIWSFYEAPRSAQPDDLKRSADKVAAALKNAVRGKTTGHP